MSLKKAFAVAAVAATFAGTQYVIADISHNAPKRPEAVGAVTRSLRAEVAQAQKTLPDGKVITWTVPGGNAAFNGTATIVGHDDAGCYNVDVQTNLKTGYKSEATYKVCP